MEKQVKDFMTSMPRSIRMDMNLKNAQDMMKEQACHHLPVLDSGVLLGIVSQTDLDRVKKLSGSESFLVEEIMTENPVTVEPDMDVLAVARLMRDKNIGSVIVAATQNQPWGIFTSTDALKFLSDLVI